jgi:nitrate reductase beta subunit
MSIVNLPEGFEDLQRFVGKWSLATEQERMQMRVHSSMDEISDFYNTLSPRIEEMLAHLEQFPAQLEALSEADQQLATLGLSFMECSRIFEMWGAQDVHCANFPPERLDFAPTGSPG